MGALIGLIIVAVIGFFLVAGARRRPTSLVIENPTWAVVNARGDAADPLIASDLSDLTPVLGDPVSQGASVSKCDLLWVYASVAADGTISDSERSLAELASESGAKILVLAAENPGEIYMAASTSLPTSGVNLVLTIDRKDAAFGRFFAKLFSRMLEGEPMPTAWVALAPQSPEPHPDAPETIFVAGAGQVVFSKV